MKMSQTWKKHGIELTPGTKISGKWHGKTYLIKRKLGSGAIGSVFLCENKGNKAALKISENRSSITMEVNVLKALQKVQGERLGPSLIDVDDWKTPGGNIISFYVMEYLAGNTLSAFIKSHGNEWIGVFMLQLLGDLERLHQSGWVFGDLKMENLLVMSSPARIRWIDVGGTTRKGRAIKEYTEFYDRGYWGLGSRRAEASYDLFAFAMVFLQLFYPKRFQKGMDPERIISTKINDIKALHPYRQVLIRAIQGKYQTGAQMKKEIATLLYEAGKKERQTASPLQPAKISFLIETGGIFLLALFYYVSSLLLP